MLRIFYKRKVFARSKPFNEIKNQRKVKWMNVIINGEQRVVWNLFFIWSLDA